MTEGNDFFSFVAHSATSVYTAHTEKWEPSLAVCLCSLHSWCRFFPRCPLWLCCIYPVYYFCVCTDLEFHLLLTGMRFCSTTYKAVLVRVCLGLKNIPPPLLFTYKRGLQPSTKESVSSRFGLSPAQTSLLQVLAICSGKGSSGISVPEVITKILSLRRPCVWLVALLVTLNMSGCILVERHVGQC